ncbi:hypothetical protein AK830_g5582 [Neonectria ditissima]|uniref:Mid2 domain-containing protein n=1 Tax=Neonectria ditissima TaxID=78410 RepID=A0A0P7BIQ2_9HYPO|nr:hypothetical protein AK830_g5582 [Neonectria ditissima]
MPRPVALLAWGALAVPPAAAWLKNPWLKSAAEESWKPAAETGLTNAAAADDHQLALGWSPRPTEAPALYARMNLVERMDGYTLGSDTCGFIENGNSFTCITAGETCSFSSGYIGCCSTTSCNVVRTTCIDYDASSAGECDLPDDFHTLCCGTSSIGACFTYVLSTTGSGDESDGTFTLLGCAASTGTSTLFDYDPAWASTHSVASDSTTASESDESSTTASETETSAAATTTTADDDDDDDSGPPVGAIAGGAVGGVALLALVGLAIFFILRKKRAAKNQQPPPPPPPPANQAAVPPPMSQQQHQQQQQPPPMSPQSPQSFAPSSPSGTLYPSGVPSNFQGYSPQQGTPLPYDPNMNAYGQQAYSPQPGYNGQGYAPPPPQGYPPQDFQQQGFQQHQQGFQQQGQYNQYGAVPAYAPPSSTSPPPNMTPSPAPKESEPVYGGQQQQQQQHHHSPPQDAQELPVIHPVGNEGNRAELS